MVTFFFVKRYLDYPEKLKKFHALKLEGRISYLHSSSGGTRIAINNSDEKHTLYTDYNETLESFFYRFAMVGDSIYKEKNDQYVHLFKNGKEYLFRTKVLD